MTPRLKTAMKKHFALYHFNEHERRENGVTVTVRSLWVFHHPRRRRHAEAGDRFFNLQKSLKAAPAKVGVEPRWRVHDLRHRRCTTWLAARKSPVKVQKALGHASLATTKKYTHLVRDDLRTLVDDEAAVG